MELVLTQRDQASIRQLLRAEPEAGRPGLPDTAIDALAKLFPNGVVRSVTSSRALAGLDTGLALRVATVVDGTATVIWLRRPDRPFTTRELALARMLEPSVEALLRRRPRLVAAEPLSTCERRVLELVASGARNSDVAAQLGVTVATVRKHLEHTYRKLGVNSRTAAVAAVTSVPAGV